MTSSDLLPTAMPGNIWELFHQVWGQAKASPEYNKAKFLQLEKKILDLQKLVTITDPTSKKESSK